MRPHDLEEESDDLDERQDPDESDMDDSDEPEFVPCPYCHKSISEDAERCHHCGSYTEETARRAIPVWVIIGIVFALIVIIAWSLR